MRSTATLFAHADRHILARRWTEQPREVGRPASDRRRFYATSNVPNSRSVMWQHSRALALSAAVAFLVLGLPAAAQHQPSAHMPAGDKDYLPAMDKMHKDMMAAVDPDPTKSWVKMMIPHHQGAIDMSKAVLQQTKDPKIRAMAEQIVKDQSAEIKELQDWLKKNGG